MLSLNSLFSSVARALLVLNFGLLLSFMTAPVSANTMEDMLTAVNAERAQYGLSPLVLSYKLTQAAQTQADDMAFNKFMSHYGSDGSSPFDRMKRVGYNYKTAGENVAAGYDSVTDVMVGWMNSEGHRANILDSSFTQLGVGYQSDSNGRWYWVQTFGTPFNTDSNDIIPVNTYYTNPNSYSMMQQRAEILFNLLEYDYPVLFAPSRVTEQMYDDYGDVIYYRIYDETNSALAVYMGDFYYFLGDEWYRYGSLDDVNADLCYGYCW